jgi:hypothetical protein
MILFSVLHLRRLTPEASWILPLELKRSIATFCSPKDLASLAQVHTSYQVEAERMLYRHMAAIQINSDSSVALNTLKTRPQKAIFVRQSNSRYAGTGQVFAATASLCDALVHMESLVGLRIRLPYLEDDSIKTQINKILWSAHLFAQ